MRTALRCFEQPTLTVAFVVLWCALVVAPGRAVAFSQSPTIAQSSSDNAPPDQKTRELILKLGGTTYRVRLSVGVLGLSVILLLAALLAVAILLAVLALRKARHAQIANRQLKIEITERQRSEEELRKTTEMVQTIGETAPLAMSAVDLEGRITFWNPASEQMFGWSAIEVMGQRPPMLPADQKREFEERLQLYNQRHRVKSAERKWQRKDGTVIDVNLWTAPLTDSQGNVVGTLGINADVTERNRAVEQLRLSELRFRQLADSMPQIVWTASENGSIEYLNRRWYEFTDCGTSNHLTEDVHSIIHSNDVRDFVNGWESAVQANTPYEAECRFADRRKGGYRWYLCRAVPVRDSSTDSSRWFGTFTDIHDQKRMEAAFRRAKEDLNRFAYSTGHDLQEPLRNVSTYSQLLEKKYGRHLDADATSFIRFISRDAQRMCTLITNLAVYTGTGSSAEQSHDASDANAAVEKALETLQAVISENQAVVVRSDLPPVRMAEKDLQQLFQNLIQNAIQYRRADAEPRIDISAHRKGNEWIFSIKDNGIGISAQYTEQIFGVFRRLHGAGQYASTGMGLAICEKIVEHYGGHIWVESEPGAGSNFHFSVPGGAQVDTLVSKDEAEGHH
jgi:PAS domain S-box-containing protein